MITLGQLRIEPQHIKELRNRRKWTQRYLADLLGVDIATVNRWENAKVTPTGTTHVVLVALLLGDGVDLVPESPEDELQPGLSRAAEESRARRLSQALQEAWKSIDG